jgi:hypothetical protein
MMGLDTADLIVIASEVLGCGTDAALAQADIGAADAALARAGEAGRAGSDGEARLHPAEAADAATALMDALLRHPPFPAHREQIAVAAGLQFLAVNGWQAYIDVPRAAVIVIERLAAGQLTPPQAASWLAAHLFPDPSRPAGQGRPRGTAPAKFPVTLITGALRRRYRRRRHLSPFLISVRPGGGSITTMVTGPLALTGRASEAVALARREASRLGRPRGPEHILLGLTDVGDGLAVKALERLGVRPEAVREQVEQATSQEPERPPGDFPDKGQTRRVWHAVADEAFARGDDYIGTEHFLLALFCDEDNAAAQVLTRLGAGQREVRAAVAELLAESGRERSA